MTVWGDWVKNEWNFRSGINVTQTGVSDDHYTFAVDGYSQSTQSVINYGKSVLQWSESGDPDWHDLGTVYPSGLAYGETAHNNSLTDTFTRYYGRTRTAQYRHWFSSPGSSDPAYQAGGYAKVDLTIEARPYAKPRAPKSGRVAYTSDNSITVGWQANYDDSYGAQPWTGVYVWRSTDGGTWQKVATLSWDKTSWADTTTSANHSYAYQVSSYNHSGESEWTACGTVRTTPSAPAGVSVTRTSATAFKVGATSGSNWANSATKVQVRASVDGGDWKDVATSLSVGGTVAYSGAANHRYRFACRAYGTNSWGALAYSGDIYTAPSAPSGAAVVRASDTSQKVTWALGANAAACWQGVYVQRSVDGGAWASLASLSGTPTNHTDGSTAADHRYRYRVASWNGYATSGWTETGDVYTTPRAPSAVYAAATGPAAVEVSATGLSAIAEAFEVSHRAGAAGEWETATRVSSLPCAMSSVTGENYYRVRALRGSLASAWTESAGVTTAEQPKAPTLTGVSSRYATGAMAPVGWVPNHPDGSAQVAAQVESTAPDGTVATADVAGATASCDVGPLSKGHWSVRVRTKGAWAEGDGWGEWSEAAEFDAYDLPVVSLTSPGDTVDRMPVTVEWEASDETGIASQSVELVDASGSVVFAVTLAGEARSFTITARDFLPDNGASYAACVEVTAGSSFTSGDESTFTVAWDSPSTPSAALTVTGGLAVRVRVDFAAVEGLPATDYVSLWREYDGEMTLLADGMGDGEEAIDYLPPLNADFSYVLVAHSESTAQTRGTAAGRVDSDGMEAFSFGADASRCLMLGLSADVSDSVAHTGETFRFALGEGAANLPTFYPDGGTSATGTRSYDMTRVSQYRELLSAIRDPACAVCWYRDFWGGRHRVMATWQTSYASSSYSLWRATASVTEVAWEEPNHG